MTRVAVIGDNSSEIAKKLVGLTMRPSTKDLLTGITTDEKFDEVLIILIDGSGSMTSAVPMFGNQSKIEVAWQVFKEQLAPNMAGWAYGIIRFSDSAEWLVFPQKDTRALTIQTTPRAMGLTALGKGLQMAWQWTRGHAKKARFIVLSDGQPNDMSKENILGLAQGNKSIPIDTVGIGQGSFDYNPEFLRSLSRITGGMFSEPNNVTLLANTIKELSPAVRPLLGLVEGGTK